MVKINKLEKIAAKIAKSISQALNEPLPPTNEKFPPDTTKRLTDNNILPKRTTTSSNNSDSQSGKPKFDTSYRNNFYYRLFNRNPGALPAIVKAFAIEHGYMNPAAAALHSLPKPRGQGYFTSEEIQKIAEQELVFMAALGVFNNANNLIKKGVYPQDILAAGVLLRLYGSPKATPYNWEFDMDHFKRTGQLRKKRIAPELALYRMAAEDPNFDRETLLELLRYNPPPIPYKNYPWLHKQNTPQSPTP